MIPLVVLFLAWATFAWLQVFRDSTAVVRWQTVAPSRLIHHSDHSWFELFDDYPDPSGEKNKSSKDIKTGNSIKSNVITTLAPCQKQIKVYVNVFVLLTNTHRVHVSFFLQVNYTLLGEICNLWRNYDDIQDSWDSVQDITDWFFDNQEILQPEAGPGRWNDPDMVCLLSFLCPTIVCPLLTPIPLSFFLCSPLCSCLILYSPQNWIGRVFTLFHIYFGLYLTFIEACIHYLLSVVVLLRVTLTLSTSLVNIHLVPAFGRD